MIIRAATQADQDAILQLEQTIFDAMDLAIYDELSVADVQAAWRLAVTQSDQSRYHYRRALVAQDDAGQVIGVLFGYPDTDESVLDTAMQTVLADQYSYHRWLFEDSEVFENEWYIDSVVVTSSARGQGVGQALLKAAETRARQEDRHVIGLNVDDSNPDAMALYQRLGFVPKGDLMIGSHHYTHMQKNLI